MVMVVVMVTIETIVCIDNNRKTTLRKEDTYYILS